MRLYWRSSSMVSFRARDVKESLSLRVIRGRQYALLRLRSVHVGSLPVSVLDGRAALRVQDAPGGTYSLKITEWTTDVDSRMLMLRVDIG